MLDIYFPVLYTENKTSLLRLPNRICEIISLLCLLVITTASHVFSYIKTFIGGTAHLLCNFDKNKAFKNKIEI